MCDDGEGTETKKGARKGRKEKGSRTAKDLCVCATLVHTPVPFGCAEKMGRRPDELRKKGRAARRRLGRVHEQRFTLVK